MLKMVMQNLNKQNASCQLSDNFILTQPVAEVLAYKDNSVSACAGLTNQLLSCRVGPRIAWNKTLTQQL